MDPVAVQYGLVFFSGLSAIAGWMAVFIIRGISSRVEQTVRAISELQQRTVALETWRTIAMQEIGILRRGMQEQAMAAAAIEGRLGKHTDS